MENKDTLLLPVYPVKEGEDTEIITQSINKRPQFSIQHYILIF